MLEPYRAVLLRLSVVDKVFFVVVVSISNHLQTDTFVKCHIFILMSNVFKFPNTYFQFLYLAH